MTMDSGSSVFRSEYWINTIRKTYKLQEKRYISEINTEQIISLFEISIPFMYRKGVSLPFSDYYVPFPGDTYQQNKMIEEILRYGKKRRWQYYEFRGGKIGNGKDIQYQKYIEHFLNLTNSYTEIQSGIRKRALRKIKLALENGITTCFNTDLVSLKIYYKMHCLTRKRQGIPPQPFKFFREIYNNFLINNFGIIALAYKFNNPVSGQIYLTNGTDAIYKFGASSRQGLKYSASYLLMEQSIIFLKNKDITTLSFGRTSPSNKGLIQFKQSWGGEEKELIYTRIYLIEKRKDSISMNSLRPILKNIPVCILKIIGNLFYKYAG